MTYITFASDPPAVWDLYPTYAGRVAYDVGANGGMVTNILACGFEEVVAFEPCEESYEHLFYDPEPNVTTVPLAVSDHTGIVALEEAAVAIGMGELVTGTLAGTWGESLGTRDVGCISLPDAFDSYGVPDFIKIDTEGHELQIIRGGWKDLELYRPKLLIEIHNAQAGLTIRDLLPSYHWEQYLHPSYAPESFLSENHYHLVST